MGMTWKGNGRGQQSMLEFTASMEAAGLLVRIMEEKRVDQLPQLMEQYPKQAVLVERIKGSEFSFLANAYATHEQYAWAMGCDSPLEPLLGPSCDQCPWLRHRYRSVPSGSRR